MIFENCPFFLSLSLSLSLGGSNLFFEGKNASEKILMCLLVMCRKDVCTTKKRRRGGVNQKYHFTRTLEARVVTYISFSPLHIFLS